MFDEILYKNCILCRRKILTNKLFCDECETEFYEVSNSCSGCGFPVYSYGNLNENFKFCKNCYEKRYFNFIYVDYWYKSSLKVLLREIKFKNNLKAIGYLKSMLLSGMKLHDFKNYDLIAPVPSHILRKLTRFLHPTDIAAKIIAKKYNLPLSHVLKRRKNSEYQWKLKRKARQKNVKNSFLLVKNVFGLKILLIDDIYTSGATVNECSKLLKFSGAAVVDLYLISKGVL